MCADRIVRIAAGFFVILSVALGAPESPLYLSAHWLWFTVFVGANLLQSAFTGLCPLLTVLKRLGVKSAGAPC